MELLNKKNNFICFLFLIFYSLQSFAHSDRDVNYLKMNKYETKDIYFGENYYYLDLSDFQNDDYLYFIVKVEYGKIEDLKMYFQDIFQIPTNPLDLTKFVNPCSSEAIYHTGQSYYIHEICTYAIPKPKDNYIIFSIPRYILVNRGKVTIKNSALECSRSIKENSYLNVNTGYYEECYDKCKKCSGPGNSTNNNCDKCVNGYDFLD